MVENEPVGARPTQGEMVPSPWRPESALAPGGLVRRELAALGLSQSQLASRTGLSPKHINQVIQGVVPISTSTSLLFERTLGLSADLLASMEAGRQSRLGRVEERKKLRNYADWYREFPIQELDARGIVDRHSQLEEQIGALLAFFGVADPSAFSRLYDEKALSFRRAQHHRVNARATAVWLRLAEREAATLPSVSYDRKRFDQVIRDARELTLLTLAEGFPKLQSRCASAGVAVVHIPDIEGARAYAASRWVGPTKPLIALTGRGKFEDGVWFSFFHEAGHILLHPQRRSVVHLDDRFGDDADGAESEANDFARFALLGDYPKLQPLARISTLAEVRAVARRLGVHPGIVAGQVAFARGTNAAWAKFRPVRRKIPW